MRLSIVSTIAVTLISAVQANAQSTAADTGRTEPLPSRCASFVTPQGRISDSARTAARDIASRAQAASIEGDNAQATALYQQAALLNPSDPTTAYALGREYEAAHDARGMGEYCRFLALTPRAPEAADVRQRIAEMAFALPPDTTVLRIPVAVPTPSTMPSGEAAFAAGIVIPGLGQFLTHQPVGGVLVMATTAAAAFYGLQSQTVIKTVSTNATDPNGNPYTFPTTIKTTERQHEAVGLGVAAAIWLTGAIQAAVHANSAAGRADETAAATSSSSRAAFPVVRSLANGSMGMGLSIR